MPGGRPNPVQLAEAKAKAAKAAADYKRLHSDGVKPGSVKSPVPPLKLSGSTDVKVSGNHIGTVNVAAIRQFLISKGYDLTHSKDPGVGKALAGAINNFGPDKIPAKWGSKNAITTLLQKKGWVSDPSTGTQKPKAFNTSFGATTKVGIGASAGLTPGGNVAPGVRSNGSYDPNPLRNAADALGNTPPIDEALANSGAHTLDASKLSEALAGLQYDGKIRDLTHQGDVNTLQDAQNQSDIGSWYDQALKSHETAAGRDTAMTAAGVNSVKNSDAAILASLGGDASGGASTVASQQAADQGTMAALGATQDQYNADITPIVTQERAGQLASARGSASQRASDLAVQLANAKSDRGGSVAKNLMDIRQYNNTIKDNQLQRLLQIKAANQAQDQQGFNNQLAVQTANIGAMSAGAKLAALRMKAIKGSFGDTPSSVKSMIASTIYNDLHSAAPKTPQQAQAIVAARLNGAGWQMSSPDVAGYANSIISNWNQSQSQP